jgi:hypothetical protein
LKVLSYLSCAMFFIVSTSSIWSQTFTSTLDGSWTVGGNWAGGTSPALGAPGGITTNSTHNIFIESEIVLNSNLSVAGGTEIIVRAGAILTINGNVTFQNNSSIIIEAGAILIINGNLTNNNNSFDIIINGTIIIDGNFTGGNGSEINGAGNMDISGSVTTSGSGSVFGSTVDCTTNCNSSAGNPLPIELTHFGILKVDDGFLIEWITASERDSDYFELLHSTNGIDWTSVVTIPGAGNSSVTLHYGYTHLTALVGVHYYRLAQTDYDGTVKSYPPLSIELEETPVLMGRFNASGQQVNESARGLVFEQYSDGRVVKQFKE